jgi:hypothetical protein
MCLNYHLTFYLLGNCVNWVIDLFFTLLVCVCVCRILERAKHLGPGLELGDCLSFHPYTFPSLGSLMLSFHHHHLWLFGIRVLVMHLCLGYKF